MQQIKRTIVITEDNAILAGQSRWGEREITIDPTTLTPEQRAALAQSGGKLSEWHVPYYPNTRPQKPAISGAETDQEIAIQLLDWRIKCAAWAIEEAERRERAKIDREEAENIKNLQHAAEVLAAYLSVSPEMLAEKSEWDITEIGPLKDYSISQIEKYAYSTPEGAEHRAAAEKIRNEKRAWREAQEAAEKAAAEKTAADKKAQLDAWVRENGTPNQQARHAAGLLAEEEVIDCLRNSLYSRLDESGMTRYAKITWDEVEHEEDCCNGDIDYAVADAPGISAQQWDALEHVRGLLSALSPTLTVRRHTATCDECYAFINRDSLRVQITVGEFQFSREYAF